MDKEWGPLDDKGERFRGKYAAGHVSGPIDVELTRPYLLSEIDICGVQGEMNQHRRVDPRMRTRLSSGVGDALYDQTIEKVGGRKYRIQLSRRGTSKGTRQAILRLREIKVAVC